MFPSFAELQERKAEWFLFPFRLTVTALTQSQLIQIPIGNGASFFSMFLTGSFTTIQAGVDSGVCRVSTIVRDQSRQRALFNDFVNLDNLFTPGRVRAPGIAGDPSQSLNIQGLPFPYLFQADSNIEMEFRSTSDTDQTIRGAFHGVKYPKY